MSRLAGVIGSRSLPVSFAPLVSRVVSLLLSRGYGIASGGAVGADSFALAAVIQRGVSPRCTIYSAWASASGFPSPVQPQVSRFLASGGQVVWGIGSPSQPRSVVVSALLGRDSRLVASCLLVIAFVHGQSRGTLYTIRQAVRRGIPVYVFLCGDGASLPADLASHCLILSGKEVV